MSDVFFDAEFRYDAAVALVDQIRGEWVAIGSPLLADGSMGQLVPHPFVRMLREAERDASRFGELLKKKHRGPAPTAVLQAKIGKSPASKLRVAPNC